MRLDLSELGFPAAMIVELNEAADGEIRIRFARETNRQDEGTTSVPRNQYLDRVIRGVSVDRTYDVL